MTEEPDEQLETLVARADLDGLVRLVDAHCASADWNGLLRLRDAARAAVRTGRQLWPAATLAEYRIALRAPAQWAARVVTEEAGRFALGPLTEVVAQHHSWADLQPWLVNGPQVGFVAHERVLRGDVNVDDDRSDAGVQPVLDLPLHLEPWEPSYPLAVYEDDAARFDPPSPVTDLTEQRLPAGAPAVEDDDVGAAFAGLVTPWTTASNGRLEWAAVEGDHLGAIGALGVTRARVALLDSAEAVAWLAWAGASGGAHGRRRGAATGRFEAWWTVAALGGALDDWPLSSGAIGEIAQSLHWFWWDAFAPAVGWQLRLAVHDPHDDLAWALAATDSRT